jgi:glycosyltransferase involved in cell wall biosynthesis
MRWCVKPSDKLILYVGRISPIKNLEELVAAFLELRAHNARLVLVGPLTEPPYERRLRSLLAEKAPDGRVTLADHCTRTSRNPRFCG